MEFPRFFRFLVLIRAKLAWPIFRNMLFAVDTCRGREGGWYRENIIFWIKTCSLPRINAQIGLFYDSRATFFESSSPFPFLSLFNRARLWKRRASGCRSRFFSLHGIFSRGKKRGSFDTSSLPPPSSLPFFLRPVSFQNLSRRQASEFN